MRRRLLLIHNPAAGRGKAEALARTMAGLLRGQGAEVVSRPTAAAGDARRFARDAASAGDVDALVALGGDGTVAEVLNGAADATREDAARAPVAVAVVASGTANVLARALALPKRPENLAETVLHGPEAALDLGLVRRRAGGAMAASSPREGETANELVFSNTKDALDTATKPIKGTAAADDDAKADDIASVNEERFFLCAGCGLDAEVVDAVHGGRHGAISMGRYIGPVARAVFRGSRPPLAVTVDGKTLCDDAGFVLVGNVNRYGAFFRFLGDEARFDDGRLDVVCLRGRGPFDWLRFGWRAWRGRWPSDARTLFSAGSRVEVRAVRGRARYQRDGDPGGELPARFEILPSAVRVVLAST